MVGVREFDPVERAGQIIRIVRDLSIIAAVAVMLLVGASVMDALRQVTS